MIVNEKVYNVALTEKEVSIVTDALAAYCMSMKAIVSDDSQTDIQRTAAQLKIPAAKDLRNAFGQLAGRFFMCADA